MGSKPTTLGLLLSLDHQCCQLCSSALTWILGWEDCFGFYNVVTKILCRSVRVRLRFMNAPVIYLVVIHICLVGRYLYSCTITITPTKFHWLIQIKLYVAELAEYVLSQKKTLYHHRMHFLWSDLLAFEQQFAYRFRACKQNRFRSGKADVLVCTTFDPKVVSSKPVVHQWIGNMYTCLNRRRKRTWVNWLVFL